MQHQQEKNPNKENQLPTVQRDAMYLDFFLYLVLDKRYMTFGLWS